MRRYSDLDGMRGVLAIIIAVYHYGLNSLLWSLSGGYIQHAPWGVVVDVFFVLSGFVLLNSVAGKNMTVSGFFISRLFRLVPLYAVTTAVMVVVNVKYALTSSNLLGNLLLGTSFLGFAPLNPPAWSVGYELYIPLLLVACSPLLLRLQLTYMFGALCVLCIAGGYLAPVGGEGLARPVVGLLTGALVYRIHVIMPIHSGRAFPPLFCALLLAIAFTGTFPFLSYIAYPLAAVAVFLGAGGTTLFSFWPVQWLGRLSYAIYLIHWPVMNFSEFFLHIDGKNSPLVKLCWVSATILLSIAAYHWIERPLTIFGKRLSTARKLRDALSPG
jgi:peptidoglycan/LPS O-acetylase OafA/YrhL